MSGWFIKSPLNYTWWKYKLLPQLFPIFPEKFDTFVDLFCWWWNVWVNITANNIICLDKQKELIRIFKLLQKTPYKTLLSNIKSIIKKYWFSDSAKNWYVYYSCDSSLWLQQYNKEKYLSLRKDYNSLKRDSEKKDYMLLVLIFFWFNNQIRFNSGWEFNMPVWKRDFNKSVNGNLEAFSNELKNKNIEFINTRFQEFKVPDNSFVYCDPPYFLTTASYNENWAWTSEDETDLLNYLVDLDKRNIKFALSNVTKHQWKVHTQLLDWSKDNKFNIHDIKSNYNNSNYQKNGKGSKEVLITNY